MPSVCPSAFLRWLFLPPAYPYNPTLFFPFRSVAGRSFPFSKALLYGAVGYKVFPINTLATKQEEDLSGNGATARPFSRHKAPYLLCLYKRKWFAPLSSEKRNRTCNIYHHSDRFACLHVGMLICWYVCMLVCWYIIMLSNDCWTCHPKQPTRIPSFSLFARV